MGNRAESAITSWVGMPSSACCVGLVIGVNETGLPLVDFPQNPHGPCPARSTVKLLASETHGRNVSVVLLFENGDPRLPIITGIIQEHPCANEGDELPLDRRHSFATSEAPQENVRVTAENEISFVCGNSSILLKKDGKVIIKGTYLVSRSSGSNKIRGASVSIN